MLLDSNAAAEPSESVHLPVIVGLRGKAISALSRSYMTALATEPIGLVDVAGDAVDADIVLVWLERYMGPGELELLVRSQRALSGAALILGYAPTADQAYGEIVLAAGFDDVMSGRVSPRELVSRINALSRRSRRGTSGPSGLRYGAARLDSAQHRLVVGYKTIQLTPIETRVLSELMRGQGSTRSREQLLASAWGEAAFETTDRAVDNVILRLRRKLSEHLSVANVRGVGFRLEID